MNNLSAEYLLLFNTITDVDKALVRLHEQLVLAQQTAEMLFIEAEKNAAPEEPHTGSRPSIA